MHRVCRGLERALPENRMIYHPKPVRDTLKRIAGARQITVKHITGEGNRPNVIAARREAALALRASGLTLAQVGKYINRAESTVCELLGNCRSIRRPMKREKGKEAA
jgi:hypothetical protein